MDITYLIIAGLFIVAGLSLLVLAALPGRSVRVMRSEVRSPGFASSSRSETPAASPVRPSPRHVPDDGFADDDEERLELFSDDLDLNLEDFDEEPSPAGAGRPGAVPDSLEFSAVFFEDGSQLIDYSRQSGVIDPSFREYKKIRRIGSGILVVGNDSLRFQSGKKVYHFDYQKVSELKAGNNFIAALIQGSGTVKLFVIDGGKSRIDRAAELYHRFVSRA
jgi:hypothetical protein